MTPDQFWLMTASEDDVKRIGVKEMTVAELRDAGVIPQVQPGEGTSLVKRIRRRNAQQKMANKRQSKRDKRMEQKRLIMEARARGEV